MGSIHFDLPEGAARILRRLWESGFSAWVVGGCVRDTLLGRVPKDWDICTSARPEEMQRVFAGWHTVETGLKHGTLTVVVAHVPYEVTTFRVDGEYTDHRHPDSVAFVDDIAADLARRDFTVNAMAWSPRGGLVDLWHGEEDLAAGLIRCVGEPDQRFEEDALRILRALRFASAYGLAVEADTAAAIHRRWPDLNRVAPERIRVELAKLLCGSGAVDILRDYTDVITGILPELKPCVGFDQRRPEFHRYTVWEHMIRSVGFVPPVEALRLAMLLHDSGKPAVFTVDDRGAGHAWGHAAVSRDIADTILRRLRVDNATHERVLLLVEKHDMKLPPEKPFLTRQLNRMGEEALRQLIEVHYADCMAKGTHPDGEMDAWRRDLLAALDALLAERPVFTLRQLAVNGRDLMAAGVPAGRQVGETLNRLLADVMDGRLPNDRAALLAALHTGETPGALRATEEIK